MLATKAAALVPFLLTFVACANSSSGPRYFAFIDKTGQVKIRLEPSRAARSFSEGLAAVSVNGKWGFIKPDGQFAIPPQFGAVEDFSEGLALVTNATADRYWKKDTLFGYIDTSGRFVIEPRFNWASSFSEGLAPVCVGPCRNEDAVGARIGYINRNGQYVLPPIYSSSSPFSEGLARASRRPGILSPAGFIDHAGRFVIEPRFVFADGFSNGLAATSEGFINRKGEVVIASQPASEGGDFSGGWAAVLEGEKIVFIDITGQVKLRPQYQVGGFSEDLAAACPGNCGPSAIGSDQNWGYIDRAGRYVIRPQFGYKPKPFRNGLALVCFGCKG